MLGRSPSATWLARKSEASTSRLPPPPILTITTKSNQVVRDIDVIKRISERSSISIHMTVTTLRTRLARMLEPRAPRPDLRLAALRQLREAGINAGGNAMPVLPGVA